MNLDRVRQIADTVLYEGYVLYPYRASAVKNRFRWQFGVVAPRGYAENGGCESWDMQTECLVESRAAPAVEVVVRFLQLRPGKRDDWEEGEEREITLPPMDLKLLLSAWKLEPFDLQGGISGYVCVGAEEVGSYLKVVVRIENLTLWDERVGADRSTALRHSLVGAHTVLALRGGEFVSLMDPPPEARAAARACVNVHTWPVLAGMPGECDVMLSSPIILYDYPALAPESPGQLCDSTEIDELLTLRIMTLTDEEKKEARATDERARAIIDRSDSIPPEIFERLHGATRLIQPAIPDPIETFFNPPDETEQRPAPSVETKFVAGDRVRIEPRRRADSMDLFLAGRVACVEAVHRDVDGRTYLAVALDGDLGDLNTAYKRFFYFDPDELRPI